MKYSKEESLCYILGALLGDGCVYKWKNQYQVWLIGNSKFTKKYANHLSNYLGKKIKNYKRSKRNFWFVCVNNVELYYLVVKSRENLTMFGKIKLNNFKNNRAYFIEGFFDAEGCVKIIKEKVRKTPKICLDICNTNFELIDFIKCVAESELEIKVNYSNQESFIGKDGCVRKKCFHLRVYKKEYIRTFFKRISTIKLTKEKKMYLEKWLSKSIA